MLDSKNGFFINNHNHYQNNISIKNNDGDLKNYFTENSKKINNKNIEILTKGFTPVINKAYSKYVYDKYIPVINKIENEHKKNIGLKSEIEIMHEKYFRKSLSRPNSPKKKTLDKKEIKNSYLIENKIITKNDILTNPCNRNLIRLCKTPPTKKTYNDYYEKEISMKYLADQRKTDFKYQLEKLELQTLKPFPGVDKGSQKIIKEKALDQRPPLYIRFDQVKEEKNLKVKLLQKNLNREYSLILQKSKYSNNLENYRSHPNKNKSPQNFSNNNPNNISLYNIKTKNVGNFSDNDFKNNNSKTLTRSKSFNSWIENNKKWEYKKNAKKEEHKYKLEQVKLNNESIYTTFNPKINYKSDYIANLKNINEHPGSNVFDKLFNSQNYKKVKIQNLQKILKPSFMPKINKFPKYLLNNTTNQFTKSFYVEEKDDYTNYFGSAKTKSKNDALSTRDVSKKDIYIRKESKEFKNFKNEVEKNHYVNLNKRNCKKSKREVEEFFKKLSKGTTTNYALEINDIKFYNEIHKN